MSDTSMVTALILAAGMATAGGLVLDESPKTKVNLSALKSGRPTLNQRRLWCNSGLGSSLNRRVHRIPAWLKGPGQHLKSMTP